MTLFSDEELDAVHSVLYDEVYYGDDEIVYTDKGDVLRRALGKVEDEIEKRRRV